MSLPGLTRQSMCFEKALAKWMDGRVKPGHNECFCVAWFKAQFRDLAARSARVFPGTSRLLNFRGRRECRALDAPAASCVKKQTHERSHHGHTGTTRHSPRNGFTAYFALSPVTRLV